MALFLLANYTFESIILHDEYIEFEAGFGKDNAGSIVTIPYVYIFQIIVDESVLSINPSATIINSKNDNKISQKQKSINAFKLNPKNKKFID